MRSRLLLPALLLAACTGAQDPSGPATLEVHLTDAPGDYDEVVVTVDGVSVKTSGSEAFVDLALNADLGVGGAVVHRDPENGRVTIDLTELTAGRSLLLATGTVPGGSLEQVRLHLVEDTVDGTPSPWVREDVEDAERQPLKVPSGFQSGLKIVPRGVDVPGGGLTSITLDFDASKSVVALGGRGKSNRAYDFLLKPVIFVLEAESLVRPTTTIATGFDAATGVAYTTGAADRIVVSDASGFVVLDPADYEEGTPIDAEESALDREETADPAAAAAANGGSLFVGAFGGALFHADALDLDGATSDDLGGDDLTAVVPAGDAWFVARAGDILYVDPDASGPASLGVSGLGHVTGLAFFPGEESFGTLVATDRGSDASSAADDRILRLALVESDGAVTVDGDPVVLEAATLEFLDGPAGVAANLAGTGFFVVQRGNGFVHEISLSTLAVLGLFDTGLGAGSLAGIAVVAEPLLEGFAEEDEVLLLAATNGGSSTIEAVAAR